MSVAVFTYIYWAEVLPQWLLLLKLLFNIVLFIKAPFLKRKQAGVMCYKVMCLSPQITFSLEWITYCASSVSEVVR